MSVENRLHITFTMDCERIRKYSPPGGPESWELSERAVRGYLSILSELGFKGTFFIVPEAAERHREIFLEASDMGFELGMHYHPQSFLDGRFQRYLGEYGYEEQLSQLSLALNFWEGSLGFKPKSFRPGNASSNEHTYKVLERLGFRQGSTYIPERNMPKYHAVYVGANPYPHHVKGLRDFLEVPMTSDMRVKPPINKDPPHLRVEWGSLEELLGIIDFWINHLVEEGVSVKSIVVITHNFIDYSDMEGKYARRVKRMAERIRQVAGDRGLKIEPVTIGELHEIVDKYCVKI